MGIYTYIYIIYKGKLPLNFAGIRKITIFALNLHNYELEKDINHRSSTTYC